MKVLAFLVLGLVLLGTAAVLTEPSLAVAPPPSAIHPLNNPTQGLSVGSAFCAATTCALSALTGLSPGDDIYVFESRHATASSSTPTDTLGLTYINMRNQQNGQVYFALDTSSSSSDTITCQATTTAGQACVAWDTRSLSNSIDAAVSSNNVTSYTIHPAFANDLIIFATAVGAQVPYTISGASFTALTTSGSDAAGKMSQWVNYTFNAAAGTFAITTSVNTVGLLLAISANQVYTPNAPTEVGVVGSTSSSLTLTWLNPQTTLTNVTVWTGTSCNTGTSTAHSVGVVQVWQDTGLGASQTVAFTVEAFNSAGGSPRSTCVQGTTNATSTVYAPSAPLEVKVVASTVSSLVVDWLNPRVNSSLTNATVWTGTSCASGTSTPHSVGVVQTWTDTPLVSKQTVAFTVEVFNSAGGSPRSVCVQGTTNATTVPPVLPGAPSSLAVVTTYVTNATLSWTAPSGILIVTSVLFGLTCGAWSWVSTFDANATVGTLTGLTPFTAYCATVDAANANGTGVVAHPFVNFTTPAAPMEPQPSQATDLSGLIVDVEGFGVWLTILLFITIGVAASRQKSYYKGV